MIHRDSFGRNHLCAMRRIRGLRQKQLARLLGYRNRSVIARFEGGHRLPPLKTALLLELVLGARLPELYVDLYEQLRQTILKRADRLPESVQRQIRARLLGKEDS